MTRRQKFTVAGILFGVMLFELGMFSVAYVVTSFVYQKLGQTSTTFAAQVVTWVLGLLFSFIILTAVGRYIGSRQNASRMGVFVPIVEAMNKIAKGDFNIRVEQNLSDGGGILSELAKSVNNMALELDKMETMRQEFISDVSHEIQSPLTSIRGFAQALKNEQLDPEARTHYLDIIETESVRLSKLSENLLKLASLESDQVKFEPQPYRLDRQIRDLTLLCEPQWSSKVLELELSLDSVEITADEDLLRQVWLNLIHNSIKFTPNQGKICIDLYRRDSKIEVAITDTGIGISEADQAHIFERFYKADRARTRSTTGGSGLGLSIAQKIVEMHQGTISLESKIGNGTRFTVSLHG